MSRSNSAKKTGASSKPGGRGTSARPASPADLEASGLSQEEVFARIEQEAIDEQRVKAARAAMEEAQAAARKGAAGDRERSPPAGGSQRAAGHMSYREAVGLQDQLLQEQMVNNMLRAQENQRVKETAAKEAAVKEAAIKEAAVREAVAKEMASKKQTKKLKRARISRGSDSSSSSSSSQESSDNESETGPSSESEDQGKTRKRKHKGKARKSSRKAKKGNGVKSAKEVEEQAQRLYLRSRNGAGGFKQTVREAEARRIVYLEWAVARKYEEETKKGKDVKSTLRKVMMMIQKSSDITVEGLQNFDRDMSGEDTSTKVRRLTEHLQQGMTREYGLTYGAKVADIVTVPDKVLDGGFPQVRTSNYRGTGIATGRAGTAGPGPPTAAEQQQAILNAIIGQAAAAAAPAPKPQAEEASTVNAFFRSMMASMGTGGAAAAPTAPALAGPPPAPGGFAGYQSQRPPYPRGPCFICGEQGHQAMMCPKKANGVAAAAAAAQPPPVSYETQHTPHEQSDHEREEVEMNSDYNPFITPGRDAPGRGRAREEHENNRPERGMKHSHNDDNENAHRMQNDETEQELTAVCDMSVCDDDDVSSVVRRNSELDEKGQGIQGGETCECGYCGKCVLDIDIMRKEPKIKLNVSKRQQVMPAKLAQAANLYTQLNQNEIIQVITEFEKCMFERWEERKLWVLEAKQQEGEEEPGPGGQEEKQACEGGPARAKDALRNMIRQEGNIAKKMYTHQEQVNKTCSFCLKKGHTHETCMVRPRMEKAKAGATELQKKKREFMATLCERQPMTKEEREKGEEETRLETVERIMEKGRMANEGNPWESSEKRRDKLRKQLGYWWAIGADRSVLMWIGFGVKLYFEKEPERVYFPNHRSYHEHVEHVRKEHAEHLADGSFRIAEGREIKIGNPLQVEVNAKGKARMCSDDRFVNAHMADYEFTQETLNRHVPLVVDRGALMITTDVAKAYYQVPLHKDSQAYCAWRHDGQWIVPTIGVFGLGVMPFVFTKIMRPTLKFMRALLMKGTNCIDDNLWAEVPIAELNGSNVDEMVKIVKIVFGSIGWVFNDKAVFEPATLVVYNGMFIDSRKYEIRAVDEKIAEAKRVAWRIWYTAMESQQVLLNDLQKLTGRLQSLKLALEGVAVWTRGLYADIARGLEASNQRPAKGTRIQLREAAMLDLQFWAYRLGKQNGLPIADCTRDVHITMNTDASDVGWGASTDVAGSEKHGELPTEVLGSSSTAREIAGVLCAVEEMKGEVSGKRVLLKMDSYPAIRNFINGGGPIEELNELVRQWWCWCKVNGVTPTYQWIPREENTRADELSKIQAESYTIYPQREAEIRAWLDEVGEPGTRANKWEATKIFAPKADKVAIRLQEMIRSKAPTCILVPAWPGSIWWPTLQQHSYKSKNLGIMKNVVDMGRQEAETDRVYIGRVEAHIITPEKRQPR